MKPSRRHTAISSSVHRPQPPIQAEWRWVQVPIVLGRGVRLWDGLESYNI